ncbi:hypothetical protein O181_069682 [Austropuccinia psidii MF-1]|uniref:Uncharacterized protein n=1 Tax=Austropuccinia psidii MF-1 TaxID=1389203 RepID=A0A9Q3F4M0_9BASI|nr:hypothetical protein [Austropuccinia psidii MF-1]
MQANIQSNQIHVEKEEERPGPDLMSLPQKRNVWRRPEFLPFPRNEPFTNENHRNISVPVQKMVQTSQGRGVGSMPKPLARDHGLLLTHQEISGLVEDHRAPRRVEPIVLQRTLQTDKELVEEPKSFIQRKEEGVGNDPIFGERRPSGI